MNLNSGTITVVSTANSGNLSSNEDLKIKLDTEEK